MKEEIASAIDKIKKIRKLIGAVEKYFPALYPGKDHAEVFERDGKYQLYTCNVSYRTNDHTDKEYKEISEKEFLSQLKFLHKNLLSEARVFTERNIIKDMVEDALKEYK